MSPRKIVDQAQQLLDGGDPDGCMSIIGYVLDIFPNYYQARLVRALAFETLARMSDSADDAAFVLGVVPHNGTALLLSARLQSRKGDRQQAQKLWTRASETDPCHTDLRNSIDGVNLTPRITHGLLGYTYLRSGWPELAERQLRAAIDSDSVRTDIRLALAESLWSIGRLDDCRRHSRTVLDHHPDCLKALLMMAHIFTEIGRTNHAAELLDRASSLDPEQRLARETYGRLEFDRMSLAEPASIAPPPGVSSRAKIEAEAGEQDRIASPERDSTPEQPVETVADPAEPEEAKAVLPQPSTVPYLDDTPAPVAPNPEAAEQEQMADAPAAIDSDGTDVGISEEPIVPAMEAQSPETEEPLPPSAIAAIELAREGYWDEAMNLVRVHSAEDNLQAWEAALREICGLDEAPATAWEILGDVYMRQSLPQDGARAYARANELKERDLNRDGS